MKTTAILGGLALLGSWALAISGCTQLDAPARSDIDLLRAQFPARASQVLGEHARERFSPVAEGFALASPSASGPVRAAEASLAARGGRRALFPASGEDPVRLSLPDGLEIEVREQGLRGAGRLEGGAVRYGRGAGEASFWSATESGFEEWLLVRCPADRVVARWDVRGGVLRQSGEAVEVLDERGDARLSVTAPSAYATGGRSIGVTLEARRQQLVARVHGPTLTEGAWLLVDPSWTFTGQLAEGREHHTATLLSSGSVLVAGGRHQDLSPVSRTELYDPVTRVFTTKGPLGTARAFHTATLLPTEKVLVVGGYNGGPLSSAELYDPATGTWSSTGSLSTGRSKHTATLLPSGKVLVVGGEGAAGPLGNAELYDPSTGTWISAGTFTPELSGHTATLLPSGQVFVAGLACLLHDPATGTWTPVRNMFRPRSGHATIVDTSGRIMVVGGLDATGVTAASVEKYDFDMGTWKPTGSLTTARSDHSATVLPSGKLLVSGGLDGAGDFVGTADLCTGGCTAALPPLYPRASHTATLLPNGQVLLIGGRLSGTMMARNAEHYEPGEGLWTATSAYVSGKPSALTPLPDGKVLGSGSGTGVLDPSTMTWSVTGPSTGRNDGTATLLASGKVLAAGGNSVPTNPYSSAELFDPATKTWAATASMSMARFAHIAVLLASGKVLVAGGQGHTDAPTSAELYDPKTATWSRTSDLSSACYRGRATLLLNEKVLLICSQTSVSGATVTAYLYDDLTGTWSTTGAPQAAHGSMTLLQSGKVLWAGGDTTSTTKSIKAELYDPASGTWTGTANLLAARHAHAATLLPTGQVLVAGGYTTSWTTSAEIFDPIAGTWSATGTTTCGRGTAVGGCTMATLANGGVLFSGGEYPSTINSADVFEAAPAVATWKPSITGPLAPVTPGTSVSLDGQLFSGMGEASSSNTRASASNQPFFLLRRIDNGALYALERLAFSPTSATVKLPANLTPGPYNLLVIVNGIVGLGAPVVVTGAANGTACRAPELCLSGQCSDGLCCDSACAGNCNVCKASLGAVADGTCTPLPAGHAGTAPSCSPYLCAGAGECPTTCQSDASCAADFFCSAAGKCQARWGTGTACNPSTDCKVPACRMCSNDHCVDGYCCNTACAGGCDVCATRLGASANGFCKAVPLSDPGKDPSCAPFLCAGLPECPTTCVSDTGCSVGAYCDASGTCQPRKAKGSPCDVTADCKETGCRACGNGLTCSDGFCCDGACSGGCDVCAKALGASADGTCTPLPSGNPGRNPSCSPKICDGTSHFCPGLCSSDAECGAGTYCDSNGQCATQKADGAYCNLSAAADCRIAGCRACASGHCADGFCCESACSGGCDACNAQGKCLLATKGQAGANPPCAPYACDGASASCPGTCSPGEGCASGFYCASGTCKSQKATGQPCTDAAECATGHCADGFCCNVPCAGECDVCSLTGGASANGWCTPLPPGVPCGAFLCNGSAACPGACASDADCAPGHYCNADGQCAVQKANGGVCDPTANCKAPPCRECQSGRCADGFCCNLACNGVCDVCAVAAGASANGSCTVLPARSPSPGAACGGYLCGGDVACPATCTVDDDCALGFFCGSGTCQAKLALQAACTRDAQCSSNACADGVCCDQACDSPCHSCAWSGSEGLCTQVPDGQDPRRECQASSGGSDACKGLCQQGQCAYPDRGSSCGLCAACDGTGRCSEMPDDDPACGEIECGGLNSPCRVYANLLAHRCSTKGACKTPDDPLSCTQWTALACGDAGAPSPDSGSSTADGSTSAGADAATSASTDASDPPGSDAGEASQPSGCGCGAAGAGPAAAAWLLALLAFVPGKRSIRLRRG